MTGPSPTAPLKVMTILGTRPEIIRLSCVISRFEATTAIDHVLVHTGQNYDYELNQVFFDDLGLPEPTHFLACDTTSLAHTYGDILIKVERTILDEQPDAIVILGDTNSAISALIARRMAIPVFHLEAGNRSFDWTVPEETNRRIADHIADVNLVYTEHARQNLLREGMHPQRIYLTGSPMLEILAKHRTEIDASDVVQRLGLEPKKFIIASLHREENVDDAHQLRSLLEALAEMGERHAVKVVVSTHPRTRKRLEEFDLEAAFDTLVFAEAFGFFDYNKLQLESACAVSDSGTISEEAAILGFAAVSPRSWIERPEALDTGSVIMTGVQPDAIMRAVEHLVETGPSGSLPADYEISNFSERVVSLILGRDRSLRDTQR